MWPVDLSVFRADAANQANGTNPEYDASTFAADFPQFFIASATPTSLLPDSILTMFIDKANSTVNIGRWGAKSWRYAMGLFIAHFATLYLQAYSETSLTPADAAASGEPQGLITSERGSDISTSFDHGSLIKGNESWGMWNATTYGRLFSTEANIVGMGGMFVGAGAGY